MKGPALPGWVEHLDCSEDFKAKFLMWLDERMAYYAETAADLSTSFDQVLGMRFTRGELATWRALISYTAEEAERGEEHVDMGFFNAGGGPDDGDGGYDAGFGDR